jgi:hypothetical protein
MEPSFSPPSMCTDPASDPAPDPASDPATDPAGGRSTLYERFGSLGDELAFWPVVAGLAHLALVV